MDEKEPPQGLYAVVAYVISRDISIFEKIIVLGLVLGYIVSPIDLIPDITMISWLDDIGVGTLFVAFCMWRMKLVAKAQEKLTAENKKEIPETEDAAESEDEEDVIEVKAMEIGVQERFALEEKNGSTPRKDSHDPVPFEFYEIRSGSKYEENNKSRSGGTCRVESERDGKPFFFQKKQDE